VAQRFEHDVVGSTQSEAITLARQGYPAGTLVVARAQTAGVGRLDRSWDSPLGGLYLSVLAEIPTERPSLLPLAVATELRAAFAGAGVAGLSIKWPNDLVADEPGLVPRKLSGILVDRISRPNAPDLGVIGVGVNVRHGAVSLAGDLSGRALFWEDLQAPAPTLDRIEQLVLRSVESAVERLNQPAGGPAVVEECRRYLCGVGRPVSVDGTEVGILRSLDDDGSVTVERDGSLATFHAGTLSVGADA
jgi:BirA family biotin operon repressor/biotin-[acetyl-CoA-carboxylase] ligase